MKNVWIIIAAAFFLLAVGTTPCFSQVYRYKDEKGNWCFTDSGDGGYVMTGTIRHSAREHRPLELGTGIYRVYKNREIDSATAQFRVD